MSGLKCVCGFQCRLCCAVRGDIYEVDGTGIIIYSTRYDCGSYEPYVMNGRCP